MSNSSAVGTAPFAPNAIPRPWQKRGWGLYVPLTHRRICEVPLAWKSSAEAEDTAAFIHRACNAHDDLLTAAKRVLAALNGRIAAAPASAVPVFDGIADLHDAINKAEAP